MAAVLYASLWERSIWALLPVPDSGVPHSLSMYWPKALLVLGVMRQSDPPSTCVRGLPEYAGMLPYSKPMSVEPWTLWMPRSALMPPP